MALELHDGLDSLSAVLPQLDAVMTEAAVLVGAVDRFLSEELTVGPWLASRPFDSLRAVGDDGRELRVTSHLACGRVDGAYRLHVLNATLDRPEGAEAFSQVVGEERIAWQSCAPEVRLQAFVLLPELLGLLAGKIQEITVQTARTIETVRGMLATLGRATRSAALPADHPEGEGKGEGEPEEDSFDRTAFVVSSGGSDLFKRPKVKVAGG